MYLRTVENNIEKLHEVMFAYEASTREVFTVSDIVRASREYLKDWREARGTVHEDSAFSVAMQSLRDRGALKKVEGRTGVYTKTDRFSEAVLDVVEELDENDVIHVFKDEEGIGVETFVADGSEDNYFRHAGKIAWLLGDLEGVEERFGTEWE